jgi:hypothetical protein
VRPSWVQIPAAAKDFSTKVQICCGPYQAAYSMCLGVVIQGLYDKRVRMKFSSNVYQFEKWVDIWPHWPYNIPCILSWRVNRHVWDRVSSDYCVIRNYCLAHTNMRCGIAHRSEYKDDHIIECDAVQSGRWCKTLHRTQLAFSSARDWDRRFLWHVGTNLPKCVS